MGKNKKRVGLLVYCYETKKIICIQTRKEESYQRRGRFERTQIPRGSLNSDNEPSLIGAIREFTEETHVLLKGDFYLYPEPIVLKWKDAAIEYKYQIWLLIAVTSSNLWNCNQNSFVIRAWTPSEFWSFKPPFINFGPQFLLQFIDYPFSPPNASKLETPTLEIISTCHVANLVGRKYDSQYSTLYLTWDSYVDLKIDENKHSRISHNYNEFFVKVQEILSKPISENHFRYIKII